MNGKWCLWVKKKTHKKQKRDSLLPRESTCPMITSQRKEHKSALEGSKPHKVLIHWALFMTRHTAEAWGWISMFLWFVFTMALEQSSPQFLPAVHSQTRGTVLSRFYSKAFIFIGVVGLMKSQRRRSRKKLVVTHNHMLPAGVWHTKAYLSKLVLVFLPRERANKGHKPPFFSSTCVFTCT